MKKIILIIILNLYFITSSLADDISDFQVEGMSIGDSLLDHFSEKLIKNSTTKFPGIPDAKFKMATIYSKSFGNYINVADFDFEVFEAVEIIYDKNDKNFTIKSVSGAITNTKKKNIKDIQDCKRQKEEMYKDVKLVFKKSLSKSDEGKIPVDKSGKSKYFRTSIFLTNKSKYGEIEVSCLYYVGKIAKNFSTSVGLTIKTDELNDFLQTSYKK